MNKALIAGTINHLIPIAIVLFGCSLTDFQCEGTDMASVMALYSFTVLWIQLFVELIVFVSIVICLFQGKWKNAGKMQLFFFIVSLLSVYYIGGKTF